MRLDRLLAMTVMLINRSKIPARELAAHFEVSVRTIYRDIDALNLAGIPVVSFPGNNGGIGIMEHYKIDRQVLGLSDLLTILSALKGINTTLENEQITAAMDKLHSLIPVEENAQLELFDEQFVIDILPWGARPEQKALLKTIHYAVTESQTACFTYRNNKGEALSREVEPMTLIFKGYTWYLFAYCRLRLDYRLFRISRISNLHLSGDTFIRRAGSYSQYLDAGNFIPPVSLKLKFSPAARRQVEEFFEQEQITLLKDGSLLVRINYPEDQWVYSFILGFGPGVEVLEPAHIREIIREKAKKIVKIYQT